MITGWGVGWCTCWPKMMVTQQSGIETWRLSVCMPSKVIVNFIACMRFKNAKVKVHDSWMSPNEITLLAARLFYIYIAMVGVCFVFGCVWMFFLLDAEAVTERIRNFWKGCCSKTSMNGNISMACYESQNPVTKESVVLGQANRRSVVFSSNVYSPNGGNVTGDSFSVWFSGKRYVWWSPLPQRRETLYDVFLAGGWHGLGINEIKS